MRSLSLLAITALSQTLGSPLQDLEPFDTEEEVSKVWFEDIDGNKLTDEDLVELPDHDVTTLLDGGRRGRSLASGRISQQLLDSFKKNGTLTVDANGLSCIKKLMSIEYTDYTEAMTCVHKTKERCHDTFVTQFEPHQEQVCDEKFEKTCTISYENIAVNEEVEVCKTYLCPDCTRDGPDECQTVYDTVCETKRKVHEVEDDVVNCETIVEKKCVDVKDGLLVKQECDTWPVEKCSVEKVKVRKTTPDTSCREESRELCAPKGCAEKQCHSCENQVKAAVIAKPVEECDLEPQKVCRHVTKLVPHLVSTTECVDVPQEVCGVSKINPVKKTRPAIKNWCFKTEECPSGLELNEKTGKCVKPCPPGLKRNEETGKCECPLGSFLNPVSGGCCESGFFVNSVTGECDCPPGFKLNEKTGECDNQCPSGFKLNKKTGERCDCRTLICECPAGLELKLGKCEEPDVECTKNSDCEGTGATCVNGKCEYIPGAVLLKSVVFRGFPAQASGNITARLFGKKTRKSPRGVTCDFSTNIGSHLYDGQITIADEVSLGGCWKFPLNAVLSEGGTVGVKDTAAQYTYNWEGVEMCVNWIDDNQIPWTCTLEPDINPGRLSLRPEVLYKTNCNLGGACNKPV